MDDAAVTILMECLDPSIPGLVQSAFKHQKLTFTNVLQKEELVYSSVLESEQKIEDRTKDYGSKSVLPALMAHPAR